MSLDATWYFITNSFLLHLALGLLCFALGWWARPCRCNCLKAEANPSAPSPQPGPVSAFKMELDSGAAHMDPNLGVLYTEKPAAADDLIVIKGVAEVLNRRLNEFGVYTFKQIALWDEAKIAAFSERLEFKDRVKREKWVEQSRQLHFEKYGERL